MKVIWLVAPRIRELASGADPERALTRCTIASARLRIAVAALEGRRRGHENAFLDPDTDGAAQAFDWRGSGVCVVHKFFPDSSLHAWLDACAAARRAGCRLVVDISDYPFAKAPAVQAFYRQVLGNCDAMVVNTGRMAELMAQSAPGPAVVIDDAILGAPADAAFAPGARLELAWFGHATNLSYLDGCIDALGAFARERPCGLTVVTQASEEIDAWMRGIGKHYAPALEMRFVEWSLEAMPAALRDCDLVLIPSDPEDPLKAGASANRIAEALNAGRLPVASPLPSYLPFAETAWLGRDPVEGVRWALAHAAEVPGRIRAGQRLVAERYAAPAVGRKWLDLFESLGGPVS